VAAPDQLTLDLQAADGHGFRVDLKRGGAPACIGRAAGNMVRLDDPSISRVHCSIALRGDGLVISDLDSANGTFVNGRIVNTGEAQKLEFGDDLQIGDVALRVGKCEG
jgi:pSer/pThr/pTyr-binding forkhead associated (FHA) protein